MEKVELTPEQQEQKMIAELLPTWRHTLLDMHAVLMEFAATVQKPFVWLSEQLNGTADWRANEKSLDKQSEIL